MKVNELAGLVKMPSLTATISHFTSFLVSLLNETLKDTVFSVPFTSVGCSSPSIFITYFPLCIQLGSQLPHSVPSSSFQEKVKLYDEDSDRLTLTIAEGSFPPTFKTVGC